MKVKAPFTAAETIHRQSGPRSTEPFSGEQIHLQTPIFKANVSMRVDLREADILFSPYRTARQQLTLTGTRSSFITDDLYLKTEIMSE